MEKVYKFTMKELKNRAAEEFEDGDTVICNNYYIWIKYGNYKRPSFHTTVSTKYDMRDLLLHKWPYYISDFVSRRISDLTEP